ncbi:hypothetical protein J6590_101262, partial [Homalodisca vitripennis]
MEQVREAKKRYSQQNPETNRDAVRRYTEKHPEVNRAAVRRYEDRHAGAGQDRVQVFRLMKPKISEFRHLPNSLARNIVAQGPMAHWSGKLLCDINAYKLKKTCLFEDDIFVCSHCEARLFEEEKDRKKWCCGEGAYNVTRLPPLSAPFYSNRHFLNRARAYNDLFSFCALEISGGYRHPSGLSFFKIEGRMYHQVYSLDAPGQRFATKVGDVQFVNRCRLYIDDGEERRNIAMGRSLDVGTIDTIANYLDSINPFIGDFRRL